VLSPDAWLNTAAPLSLAGLRGRFVLLDFWTFACANCLHVIDELRPLEHTYADILTVVGVHSPKFAHEAEPAAVAAAVERYDVRHPVVNDPSMSLWQQYAVRAWPTLVLVDPEGYVVAQAAGEGQVSALAATIERLATEYDARGTLRRGDSHFEPRPPQPSTLRFPARAILLPAARTGRDDDSLLVADAGHHQLVELALDGETVLRRIGTGERGRLDGPAATLAEPNGLALLPADLGLDYDVVVADTANHVLRGVRLNDGAVTRTLDLPHALRDARTITGPVPDVLSPWDVAWWPATQRLVVAAAGVHLLLAVEPISGATEILAGTTVESLRDGPALDGWLAQPSGLAVEGEQVWFTDAESSALRRLTLDGQLHTAVGEGLFDFGHVDGPREVARMQHPLGVTLLPDGSVAVLDTYNGAVRRWDERSGRLTTLATGLAEPSGGVMVGGDLVVVESAAHRLVRPVPRSAIGPVPLGGSASGESTGESSMHGDAQHVRRPPMTVATGEIRLEVAFTPAPGRHLDDRYGPATSLMVSASPPELLLDGGGSSTSLTRSLRLADGIPDGILQVTAQAASCDDDPAVEHPACYLARQDWGVPLLVQPDADGVIRLVLLGG
jgi:thiol-disulfide isomerase/thioredoxin